MPREDQCLHRDSLLSVFVSRNICSLIVQNYLKFARFTWNFQFSTPVSAVLQILEESMLEDINCLLGSGEVPSLFTPDEEADIVVRVRDAVRATGNPDTQVSGLNVATAGRTSLPLS